MNGVNGANGIKQPLNRADEVDHVSGHVSPVLKDPD